MPRAGWSNLLRCFQVDHIHVTSWPPGRNIGVLPSTPVKRIAALALSVAIIAAAAEAEERQAVSVLLTTAPAISPATRTAMIREATQIWARAGIQLRWASPTVRPSGLSLRVLTVEHTGPAAERDHSVLGELVRGAGTGAAAMVAIDRAAAIAVQGSLARGALSFDERLGLILGRAVAHEIGHFLLVGSPHQAKGLMRASFPQGELADPWSTAFEVDQAMRAVALGTLRNGLPVRMPSASIPAVSIDANPID